VEGFSIFGRLKGSFWELPPCFVSASSLAYFSSFDFLFGDAYKSADFFLSYFEDPFKSPSSFYSSGGI